MSYIPDYRGEDNERHLTDIDKAFLLGYRCATDDAKCFFDNTDMYECTENEEKTLEEARGCFDDWMEMEEIQQVCGMFEDSQYDDIELTDHNPKICDKCERSKEPNDKGNV